MLFTHYKKVMEVKRDRTMFNKAFGDQIKLASEVEPVPRAWNRVLHSTAGASFHEPGGSSSVGPDMSTF